MLGATFTSLVNSLINDIFSPPLGIALGKASLENLFVVIQDGANTTMHYLTLEQGKENVIDQVLFCGGGFLALTVVSTFTANATCLTALDDGAVCIAYGRFIQANINFFIVALVLFLLIKCKFGSPFYD